MDGSCRSRRWISCADSIFPDHKIWSLSIWQYAGSMPVPRVNNADGDREPWPRSFRPLNFGIWRFPQRSLLFGHRGVPLVCCAFVHSSPFMGANTVNPDADGLENFGLSLRAGLLAKLFLNRILLGNRISLGSH